MNEHNNYLINPLASPSAGALALKYGYVNTVTTSPGEVKGLINNILEDVNCFFQYISYYLT